MTASLIPSYPKVWAVGAAPVELIFMFGDEVVVQEKVDGSQISFGKIDGVLHMKSKGQPLYADNPTGMFEAGIASIIARADLLPDNTIFRGEYLNRPRHNTLAYDRVPRDGIVLFDAQRLNSTTLAWDYLTGSALRVYAEDLGYEVVPILHFGVVKTVTDLTDLLKIESFLGGPTIEGFVVKNYHRFTRFGDLMLAKYVSPEFKEKHVKDWKNRNPKGSDFVTQLADEFATPARFTKAVQHLREADDLEDDPRDIGKLMKELAWDLQAEHTDYIKDRLFAHFWGTIVRGASRGAPEWYKVQLLERAFVDEEGDLLAYGPHDNDGTEWEQINV